MSIETALVTKVGDALPATQAQATITCVDANLDAGKKVVVTDPEGIVTEFVQGVDFDGGSGDDALAEEVRVLIAAITGLTATRAANVVTVKPAAGFLGNEWILSTDDSDAFVIVQFDGGKDENAPVDLELELSVDGFVTCKVDGVERFKVPWLTLFSTNTKPFQQELRDFLRKASC